MNAQPPGLRRSKVSEPWCTYSARSPHHKSNQIHPAQEKNDADPPDHPSRHLPHAASFRTGEYPDLAARSDSVQWKNFYQQRGANQRRGRRDPRRPHRRRRRLLKSQIARRTRHQIDRPWRTNRDPRHQRCAFALRNPPCRHRRIEIERPQSILGRVEVGHLRGRRQSPKRRNHLR